VKVRFIGESVSVAGNSPAPVSDAVCVPTLSVMLKLPLRVPEVVGWNLIETVHPTLGASAVPHVFAEMMKSPVITGVCSVAVTPLMFEIAISCAVLVEPTAVEAKLIVIGFRIIVDAVDPTPLNAAVAWPPATLP
jgi:hypothetical protein